MVFDGLRCSRLANLQLVRKPEQKRARIPLSPDTELQCNRLAVNEVFKSILELHYDPHLAQVNDLLQY